MSAEQGTENRKSLIHRKKIGQLKEVVSKLSAFVFSSLTIYTKSILSIVNLDLHVQSVLK